MEDEGFNMYSFDFRGKSREEAEREIRENIKDISEEDVEEMLSVYDMIKEDEEAFEEYEISEIDIDYLKDKIEENYTYLHAEYEEGLKFNDSFYGFLLTLSKKEITRLCRGLDHSLEDESAIREVENFVNIYAYNNNSLSIAAFYPIYTFMMDAVYKVSLIKNGHLTYKKSEKDEDWKFHFKGGLKALTEDFSKKSHDLDIDTICAAMSCNPLGVDVSDVKSYDNEYLIDQVIALEASEIESDWELSAMYTKELVTRALRTKKQ